MQAIIMSLPISPVGGGDNDVGYKSGCCMGVRMNIQMMDRDGWMDGWRGEWSKNYWKKISVSNISKKIIIYAA